MKKTILFIAIIWNVSTAISMIEETQITQTLSNLSFSLNFLSNLPIHKKPQEKIMDLSKIFPHNLEDTTQVALQLKNFCDILAQNNINFNNPLVLHYIKVLRNFPKKNELFSTAMSLGLVETIPLFNVADSQIIALNPSYISSKQITQPTSRVYIAADVPISLDNVQNYIKPKIDALFHSDTFVKEKHSHLTLLFIGDIDSVEVPQLIRHISFILGKYIKDHPMIETNKGISNLYTEIKNELFGYNKKVIVLDVKSIDYLGIKLLVDLNAILQFHLKNYISNASLSFLPHITLGRTKKSPLSIAEANGILQILSKTNPPIGARGPRVTPPETFTIDRVTLYKSEPSGPHTMLASWLLTDKPGIIKI